MILIIAALSIIGAFTNLDVFHSFFFVIPGVLLMINIFVCSLNRWAGIKAKLQGGKIKQEEAFYNGDGDAIHPVIINLPLNENVNKTHQFLKSQGYRVRIEVEENVVYIAADKNRYFLLGTYLSHFGLILFVLAFFTGSYFGFREGNFNVAVGENREVGHDTGLVLHLNDFVDEYYDNGMPKDYRSDVALLKNGQAVEQGIIRVNYPLMYNGVRFYQASFGSSVRIQISENNTVIFDSNIPLDIEFYAGDYLRYTGLFTIPEKGYIVRLIGSAVNGIDSMIPAGNIAIDIRQGEVQVGLELLPIGESVQFENIEFTYVENSIYSGFQVSHDPTNLLIWIACGLFLVGIIGVLYFPFKQVWLLIKTEGKDQSIIKVRAIAPRSRGTGSESGQMIDLIKSRILIEDEKHG